MFAISIAYSTGNAIVSFLYKTEEAARAAQKSTENFSLRDSSFSITDDFGQEATFRCSAITAVMFENMELSKNAQIERGLHQLRTQIKADQVANADPGLKAAAMLRGGNSGWMPPGPIPRA